jgi:hypothetical protein
MIHGDGLAGAVMDEGPERSGLASMEEGTDIFAPWPLKKDA